MMVKQVCGPAYFLWQHKMAGVAGDAKHSRWRFICQTGRQINRRFGQTGEKWKQRLILVL